MAWFYRILRIISKFGEDAFCLVMPDSQHNSVYESIKKTQKELSEFNKISILLFSELTGTKL
jgi:hypothetical protein